MTEFPVFTGKKLLKKKLGYGDSTAGNLLIQGDNLDAIKALLPYYAGRDLSRQLAENIRK
jgi:hypothetical protein